MVVNNGEPLTRDITQEHRTDVGAVSDIVPDLYRDPNILLEFEWDPNVVEDTPRWFVQLHYLICVFV